MLIAISSGEHGGGSETDDDRMVKDFKNVIHDYEDIVQEETQQLLDQVKELLDNKYINGVQGLVDLLKEMKIKLKSNAMDVREQVNSICYIKYDLYQLRSDIESESPMKVEHLQSRMNSLRSSHLLKYLSDDSD